MWRLVSASLQEAQAGVGTAGAFARVTTAGSVSRVRSPATRTAALEPSEGAFHSSGLPERVDTGA